MKLLTTLTAVAFAASALAQPQGHPGEYQFMISSFSY